MNLTEYQKWIIGIIIDGSIYDLNSFLACEMSKLHIKMTTKITSTYVLDENSDWRVNSNKGYLVDDPKVLYNLITEFISLWDKLERNNLIKTVPRDHVTSEHMLYPIAYEKQEAGSTRIRLDYNCNFLLNEYRKKRFIVLPELIEFRDKNFQTQNEIKEKRENEQKEQDIKIAFESLRTTQRAQWITIILAVITLLATLTIQIIYSTKERDVVIQNPEIFKDTVNVKLLNNDSVHPGKLNKETRADSITTRYSQ